MKKLVFLFVVLMVSSKAFCQTFEELTPYRIPSFSSVNEYKKYEGKIISYAPISNNFNKKVIAKLGPSYRELKVMKITPKTNFKNKVLKTEWFLQDIRNHLEYEIIIYSGDRTTLEKKYSDIYWDDEVRIFDAPFYTKDMWVEYLKKTYVGKVYSNPLVKATYIIYDCYTKYDDYTYQPVDMVKVRNSMDDTTYEYPLSEAEKYCFLEDLAADTEVYLSKVEKPDNPDILYGEIKVITDSLTKSSYEDNFINLTIFNDSTHFSLKLKNKTQHSLKILWDQGAYVDDNSYTSGIAHGDIKVINSEKAQLPSTIIRGAILDDIVVPIRNTYWDEVLNKWKIKPLCPPLKKGEKRKNKLMLPIQIKGVTNEYIFEFDVTRKYRHPERLNLEQ